MTFRFGELPVPTHCRLIALLTLSIWGSSLFAPVNSHNDTENTVKLMPLTLAVTAIPHSGPASGAPAKPNSTIPSSTLSMSTHETPTDNVDTLPLPTVRCGEMSKMVDECFKDLPSHLMEFLQTTKIVVNEKEIAEKCKVFNRGMSCFDDYTMRCMPEKKRNIAKNNVEGAKKFFQKFCNDRDFQNDYLKNKECFTYIQEDWERCTKNFQEILSDEMHAEQKNTTHKFLEFCCARHAYEECIYRAARYKCYKHSAEYARETAKTLSEERHFTNCRQYEHLVCNGASRRHQITTALSLLMVHIVFVGFGAGGLVAVRIFLSF